nr:immunoglobulin light chain junction region [Macaca mulatta]MOW58982.1 immunoglobulin light chain junction region [Macaca mulatta]MOW59171.1 immunoglobulin light chain junction region [Macaca mulatta]MOW59221.1 immunoglobulin light chain junction region [Macaca mulatta]MOW60138.1 immunoglobulin light chain junction region [Macaca mulatta]
DYYCYSGDDNNRVF